MSSSDLPTHDAGLPPGTSERDVGDGWSRWFGRPIGTRRFQLDDAHQVRRIQPRASAAPPSPPARGGDPTAPPRAGDGDDPPLSVAA